MNQPTPEALRVAESARKIALQMLSERGRGAVLVGVARVDAALEHLLQALMAPALQAGRGGLAARVPQRRVLPGRL